MYVAGPRFGRVGSWLYRAGRADASPDRDGRSPNAFAGPRTHRYAVAHSRSDTGTYVHTVAHSRSDTGTYVRTVAHAGTGTNGHANARIHRNAKTYAASAANTDSHPVSNRNACPETGPNQHACA